MALLRVSAQTDSSYSTFLRANVQIGALLPEYGFFKYQTTDFARGFEINFLKESTGHSIWEQLYRYPAWGLSFYFTTMGNKAIYGNQFSIYPYYSLRLVERKRFGFSYQMGVGASWVTKKFDAETNYQNLAIGSHFNIHYHADMITKYQISDRMRLNAGISFSHISNANLSEPNVGINIASLYAGLAWGTGKKTVRKTSEIAKYASHFTYEIMATGGMKHTRTYESFSYPALGLSFDVKRRNRYKFAWGAGIDLFYDSSIEVQMIRLNRTYKRAYDYQSGIHLTQEFIYDRVSFLLQEGLYLGLTEKLFGYSIYNRAMVRYKFSSHFFVNISLKTHLYILDFPELGFGFYW
jgi:Lipid A 3-O-deacylase (PagL)